MKLPITVEIVDAAVDAAAFDAAYGFINYVDFTFSPFKYTSEVSRINRSELRPEAACDDMEVTLELAEQTRQETSRGALSLCWVAFQVT
jgi:thiamine biosynthesis lipoprotein